MEGLKELFPVPVYINMIELDDIEIPNFEDSNVVRKEIPEFVGKKRPSRCVCPPYFPSLSKYIYTRHPYQLRT